MCVFMCVYDECFFKLQFTTTGRYDVQNFAVI